MALAFSATTFIIATTVLVLLEKKCLKMPKG
jgi:hypothetical protein